MQQPYFLLTIEFLFLISTLVLWWVRRREDSRYIDLQSNLAQPLSEKQKALRRAGKSLHEADCEVPIPWGWPNCANYRGRRKNRTASESLYMLADVLFKEKQLISEAPVNPRIKNSFRALIEDAHHPVNRNQDITKPTGQDGLPDDIWYIGPIAETRRIAEDKLRFAKQAVHEIKTPWGW